MTVRERRGEDRAVELFAGTEGMVLGMGARFHRPSDVAKVACCPMGWA